MDTTLVRLCFVETMHSKCSWSLFSSLNYRCGWKVVANVLKAIFVRRSYSVTILISMHLETFENYASLLLNYPYTIYWGLHMTLTPIRFALLSHFSIFYVIFVLSVEWFDVAAWIDSNEIEFAVKKKKNRKRILYYTIDRYQSSNRKYIDCAIWIVYWLFRNRNFEEALCIATTQ